MVATSASNYSVGVGLDTWKLSPRQLASALGAVLILPGLLWLPVQATWAGKTGTRENVPAAGS